MMCPLQNGQLAGWCLRLYDAVDGVLVTVILRKKILGDRAMKLNVYHLLPSTAFIITT